MTPARALAGTLALLAAVAIGCGDGASPQSGPPEPQGEPAQVGVVTLSARDVTLSTVLPGRTSAYRIAEVRPQVTGILEERVFSQGERVEAGQTLYRIDRRPYRAAVARAEAELARARAALGAVRARERRFQELLEKNVLSAQDYDDVEAELGQREAEVQAAQAALESARIDLGYTRVKAPIRGVIGPTLVTTGALLTSNQAQPLARVTQLDPIYVDIQRSVREMRALRRALERGTLSSTSPRHAPVTLLFEGDVPYAHPGELKVSDVTVSPSTGAVTLRAVFPNPDRELLPGMYVRARVGQGIRNDAILAPQQGITRNARGEATALVVEDDGTLARRKLEVGRALGSFWLVEEGLSEGDRLVVTGLQGVRPGDRVRVVRADIPEPPERSKGEPAPKRLGREGTPGPETEAVDG